MNGQTPDWIEASTMLREAIERYRDKQQKTSLAQCVDDLLLYIQDVSGKLLDPKTIRRDISNKSECKTLHPIPKTRVEIYARWLHETGIADRAWLTRWLAHTTYPTPGKLIAEMTENLGNMRNTSRPVKSNVPPLRRYLWGNFLGRQAEMEKLRQWADTQRHPIAILCGFGGNGKTTLQLKVGEEFVHGVKCQLRWPYQGAVWVSAVDYPRGQPSLIDILRKVAGTFELFDREINLELIPAEIIKTQVRELLQEKRVLVLLDNFETVSKPNQIEILEFFNNLPGHSQTLMSTRYRPDWFLEQEQEVIYSMAHVLIPLEGLSSEDAEQLIEDFLKAKTIVQTNFDRHEIKHLIEVTHNNPKSILLVLGLVEQGLSLPSLLDAITEGKPEADQIFDRIVDQAWQEILTENDQAVLMAKALFSHSVSDTDLGLVAGVANGQLRLSVKRLAAISFFELERTLEKELRIRTHPLAQDFARRVLREHQEFEQEAEKRWWQQYGPKTVQKDRETAYEMVTQKLEEDLSNVLEHVEQHIQKRSLYCLEAAKLFNKIGYILRLWGYWDDTLRIAEIVLEVGIEKQDPDIIGICAFLLIGRIYSDRCEFDKAHKYIGLMIEQNVTLKNEWLDAIIETARADIYRQQGYFSAAKQSYEKSLQIFFGLGSLFWIAYDHYWLGAITIEIATKDLDTATDKLGKIKMQLAEAEKYHNEAIYYWTQEQLMNKENHYAITGQFINFGVINRLRGELSQARGLFQSCIGKSSGIYFNATLYREIALVENLLGNKEVAYSYEEKGLSLFRQLDILDKLPPTHCYRVIDRMKREGTW